MSAVFFFKKTVFLIFFLFLVGCKKQSNNDPLYIVNHRHPIDVFLRRIEKTYSKGNFHLSINGYIQGSGSIIIQDSSGTEVFTTEIEDSVSVAWNYSEEMDSFLLTYTPKNVKSGKLRIKYKFE